jgi:ferredoxin-NADP reductase
LQQLHGDVVVVYRVVSAADVLFRRELDDLARTSDFELHYIVGDHMTDEGRNYLSPEHLRELVPDIADRDVYVCGPTGLTDIVTRHVRQAGVRRSHIHSERFAL